MHHTNNKTYKGENVGEITNLEEHENDKKLPAKKKRKTEENNNSSDDDDSIDKWNDTDFLAEMMGPEECPHCQKFPCAWFDLAFEAFNYYESNKADNIDPNSFNGKKILSGMRKKMYQHLEKVRMQGEMRGGRKMFFPCQEEQVRIYYPSPDGKYMGFKEK